MKKKTDRNRKANDCVCLIDGKIVGIIEKNRNS